MSSWRRASAVGILFVLLAAGVVTAISSSHRNTALSQTVSTDPTSFVYATLGEPDYLDPAVDYEESGWQVIQNVYETLIWYDGPSADNFVPVLATQVPTINNGLVSADGLNFTIHVTPGVIFHDGTALTADDVVYSIQRVLRIHDPAGPSWMLEQVMTDYISYSVGDELQNFSSSAQWVMDAIGSTDPHHVITELDVQHVSEAAVVKVDEMTVMFRLTRPYPAFVSILATPLCSIVSKDYVEAHGGIVNGEHNWWMDMNACGTGPYRLVSWEHGSSITLARFGGYHGAMPSLASVSIVQVNNESERVAMLESGAADSIYLAAGSEYLVAGKPDIDVWKGMPTFSMTFMGMNFEINTAVAATFGSTIPADFFADRYVRTAFVHLFNASRFIETVMNNNAIQPNGPIPRGMFGYNASSPVYSYDLSLAEHYLKLAIDPATGHSWWENGFTIAFIYNAGNLYREASCQFMKEALESLNPNIHATINALDWPAYLSLIRLKPSPLPMFYLGWGPDFADPDDYVDPILSSRGSFAWYTGYSNSTIDALFEAARAELNPVVREQMYHEITQLCYEDAPYIWQYQASSFHVERSWVDGYYYNPMYGGLYFSALSKSGPSGVEVVKYPGSPANSAVTWEYTPMTFGTWTGKIINNGLRWLVVDVYDVTAGVEEEVMHQRIRFAALDAYPMGTLETNGLVMSPWHTYRITVTPNGPRGSSCNVFNMLTSPEPPVPSFSVVQDHMTVSLDASGSYDPDGYIVSYYWDFGDGMAESGIVVNHTYQFPMGRTIILTVMDNDGMTASTSRYVEIVDNPPWAYFTYAVSGTTVNVDASMSWDDYGILSYTWYWGDGSPPETHPFPTASHTYPQAQRNADAISDTAVMMSRAPPPPPYLVFGFTYHPDGITPWSFCNVTITDAWTGVSMTTVSDSQGMYYVDLHTIPGDFMNGDVINVTATNGPAIGWAEGIADENISVFIQLDVVLSAIQDGGTRVYAVTLIVTDTIGQIDAVNISVAVGGPLSGAWSSPVDLGTFVNEIFSGPAVSMNGNGQAIASWSAARGSVWEVYANRYEPGLGWQGPEIIGPAMPWTYSPAVGIDANGNSTVAWTVDNTIYTRRHVAVHGWEETVVISDAVTYPRDLTLAVAPDGKAVLAWQAQVDLHWGILASVRVVGPYWSSPILIEASSASADNPYAAISSSGKAIVVWTVYGSSSSDIWWNSYVFGAGWIGEDVLEDLGQFALTPKVSMDANGDAFAVWDYMTASNYSYKYTVYANIQIGGIWQGATRIEWMSSSSPMSPDICAFGNGDAAVAWTIRTDPMPTGKIRTSIFKHGVGWLYPDTIGTGALHVQYPSVAADSSGTVHVGWSQSDGLGNVSGYNILVSDYVPGLGWSGSQMVMRVQNTSGPMLAAGASDVAVMVWSAFGDQAGVWASDYRPRPSLVAEAGPDQYLWGQEYVQFDGSGSYSEYGIVNYRWVWTAGNGTTKSLTGMTPSCPAEWFFSYGNYTVRLTITDGIGRTATDTVSIAFGFRIYNSTPMAAEQIVAWTEGYIKLRIENHGLTSFNWTILDVNLTSPPYEVYNEVVVFSSEMELLVTGPFWATFTHYYQCEYVPYGPPGSYMTVYAYFVPTV